MNQKTETKSKKQSHASPPSRAGVEVATTALTVLITSVQTDGTGRTDYVHGDAFAITVGNKTAVLAWFADEHLATVPSMAGRIVVEIAAFRGTFHPGPIPTPTALQRVRNLYAEQHWHTLGGVPDALLTLGDSRIVHLVYGTKIVAVNLEDGRGYWIEPNWRDCGETFLKLNGRRITPLYRR